MPPFSFAADVDASKPEVIVSAALYLMSSYGCSGGCPRLAHVIVKHLRILAGRNDLAPVLRSTCASMVEQWEIKLHAMLPVAIAKPAKPGKPGKPSSNIFSINSKLH